jgi:hypothetical protein
VSGPLPGRGSISLREEFVVWLDCASPAAEYSCVGGLYIPKEIKDLPDRLHAPVGNLTVQCGKLRGIALDYQHPVANGAHRSSNNFHNNLGDLMK